MGPSKLSNLSKKKIEMVHKFVLPQMDTAVILVLSWSGHSHGYHPQSVRSLTWLWEDIIPQRSFVSDQINSWTLGPWTFDVRPGGTDETSKANKKGCGVVKVVAQHPKVKSIPYGEWRCSLQHSKCLSEGGQNS